MKKGIWLSIILLFVCGAPLLAQDFKFSKKEKKEIMAMAIPACETMMESGQIDPLIPQAVNSKGYCTCIMESLMKQYSFDELVGMFSNKSKTEMTLAFYEDPGNHAKILKCMRDNMKDEAAMKKVVLNNSFGLDVCVAGVEKLELGFKIDAKGYCQCMLEKMEQHFTINELLSESTYTSEKLQIMAMECILANVADTE